MERDPFDLFLERCAREYDPQAAQGKDGTREIAEDICPACHENIEPGSRFCKHCGEMQEFPDNITGTFKPRTIIKRTLGVTLVAIDRDFEVDGRHFTKAHLRIRNLSGRRVHISLTYVDSVLIDLTGRQFSPLDIEELPPELSDQSFPTWFYIYPDAYREGILLFRESTVPLQKAIVCAMHQENEDEMFAFDLNIPPNAYEES
ncbi:MAG TPA: zinc ribbon domain-containing protein [Firmicutes bacterium]|nr:zinc ribbon domain-containing protein [Bacillota bacterium]